MVKYRRKSIKFDIINTIICIGIFLVLFFKLKFGIIISTILSIIIYTGSSLLFAPSNKLELMGITDANKQKECEELLNRGYNQLNNLIYLKNKITKSNPKKEFIKMTEKINNILKYLEKHPNKIEENKKFFTYYLETILKVSNSYYDISSQEVLYTWKPIAEKLIEKGIVVKKDDSYYIADMSGLTKLITERKKWSDIGLDSLYGYITIQSTDPNKSNSGNMFSGLIANIMNNEDVVDETTIDNILPQLKDFFSKIGYMEHSSSDLFEQYLKTGMGAKPMISGYENQMIEFAVENPNDWNAVKDQVVVLYPTPTVWSSHPLIALNEKGARLIEAMQDEEIQKIAWEKHGFRTGVNGTINTNLEGFSGIPKDIASVISMPNPNTMKKLMEGLN